MNKFLTIPAAILLLGSTCANAASISYMMNLSNTMPDGVDYLKVTIDDEGALGLINFTVETLGAFTEGGNFGLQTFAFNGAALSSSNILGLPTGWSFSSGKNVSEFGNFTNYLSGTGGSRQDILNFSIGGIDGDTLESYVALSTGKDKTWVYFAGHVAGFVTDSPSLTSAHFGGTALVPPAAVPIPAAMWLFGTGLLGLVGVARRRVSA